MLLRPQVLGHRLIRCLHMVLRRCQMNLMTSTQMKSENYQKSQVQIQINVCISNLSLFRHLNLSVLTYICVMMLSLGAKLFEEEVAPRTNTQQASERHYPKAQIGARWHDPDCCFGRRRAHRRYTQRHPVLADSDRPGAIVPSFLANKSCKTIPSKGMR